MFLSEITPNTYFLLNHQSNMWKGDHWLTDILLFLKTFLARDLSVPSQGAKIRPHSQLRIGLIFSQNRSKRLVCQKK